MLFPAVIVRSFNPIAEHAILTGVPNNEANAENETQPLRAETRKNFQSNQKSYTFFCAFHSLNHYVFFSSKISFLASSIFFI